MCMNTPCGAGVNTLTVDVNGEVYPCALMLPSLESGFKIGNIYTDSISSLIQKDSIIKNRDLDLMCLVSIEQPALEVAVESHFII